jgi:dTDP-4-dehydrorhamnose reductase
MLDKKVLVILGSTGMLGSYIYSFIKSKMKTIVINRDKFDAIYDVSGLQYLIEKEILQDDIVYIFNAIGLIPQSNTLKSKDAYFRINGYFPRDLQKICETNNWKLIQPSTDCVFSGYTGNYHKNDEMNARDLYGISKSMADTFLKNTDACIIRTSIIGEERFNKVSLLEWVINSKESVNGYTNVYWNGITCLEYAKQVYKLISTNTLHKGIKQISSKCISKYTLLQIINKVYKCNLIVSPIENTKPKNKCLVSDILVTDIENQLQELRNFIL